MQDPSRPVRVAVLVGSVRPGSNTGKAAALLAAELAAEPDVTVDRLDPRLIELRLPGSPGHAAEVAAVEQDLKARVGACQGVILVTPEYDGSYSAVMKLLIEHLGYPSVLAGLPVIILGVASGRIGADRAIEHLRSVCLHIGAIVVPGSRSLATVHATFDADGKCMVPEAEAMVRDVARALVGFVRRLKNPRSSDGDG